MVTMRFNKEKWETHILDERRKVVHDIKDKLLNHVDSLLHDTQIKTGKDLATPPRQRKPDKMVKMEAKH